MEPLLFWINTTTLGMREDGSAQKRIITTIMVDGRSSDTRYYLRSRSLIDHQSAIQRPCLLTVFIYYLPQETLCSMSSEISECKTSFSLSELS